MCFRSWNIVLLEIILLTPLKPRPVPAQPRLRVGDRGRGRQPDQTQRDGLRAGVSLQLQLRLPGDKVTSSLHSETGLHTAAVKEIQL